MSDADREPLLPAEAAWLAAVRDASTLSDLAAVVGIDDDHEAYLTAKRRWRRLRERELGPPSEPDGLPGATLELADRRFHIHGVTHADTDAERTLLREHVDGFLEHAAVYCEQGLRRMYFDDVSGVREMDDYRWAMAECRRLDTDSELSELVSEPFWGVGEELAAVAGRLQETIRSLADTGRERYGDRFADVVDGVAATLPQSHERLATGNPFAATRRTTEAATDLETLAALQRHYETTFLPQPLEREWLRRHDPELELLTHARNARMADYVLDAVDAVGSSDASAVHLIVGAAHAPGVRYYLDAHRTGDRTLDGFEPVV